MFGGLQLNCVLCKMLLDKTFGPCTQGNVPKVSCDKICVPPNSTRQIFSHTIYETCALSELNLRECKLEVNVFKFLSVSRLHLYPETRVIQWFENTNCSSCGIVCAFVFCFGLLSNLIFIGCDTSSCANMHGTNPTTNSTSQRFPNVFPVPLNV